MEITHAILIAIVQGITEFLPVSSSAHLVLIPQLFGWADQGVVFDIAAHTGTLMAVIIYFRTDVARIAKGKWDIARGKFSTPNAQLIWKLMVATAPVLLLALLISGWVTSGARALPILATTSIVFGLLLWWADSRPVTKAKSTEPTLKDSLIFGIFQAMALIPGTSRSGACVTAGRILGYPRKTSGHFASLMAMPTIAIAGLYSLLKTDIAGVTWAQNASALTIGVITSFIFGMLGIHILMRLLTKTGYWPFVIYRLALGIGIFIWIW